MMEKKWGYYREQTGFLPYDPMALAADVWKRWLLILLAAITVGAGSWLGNRILYKPVYESCVTLAVTGGEGSPAALSSLTTNSLLARELRELMNTDLAQKRVLEGAGLNSFEGSMTASVIPETNLVNIRVTASDPQSAFRAAQAMAECHMPVTNQVLGAVTSVILQAPEIPDGRIPAADPLGNPLRNGILAAVLTAILIAFLSADRDGVRSGWEAERKLACECLGEIPHTRKTVPNPDPGADARYAEEIRKLRCRVEAKMDGGKVLMVTHFPETGTAFQAAGNLALSMAGKGQKVLLMDGKECPNRKTLGLADVLTGRAEPGDAVTKYQKTGLDYFAGKLGPEATAEGLNALLLWARASYDFVVLDLPYGSWETEWAMEHADAALLVIPQNGPAAADLNRAVRALEKGTAKFLGCILEDVYSSAFFRRGG